MLDVISGFSVVTLICGRMVYPFSSTIILLGQLGVNCNLNRGFLSDDLILSDCLTRAQGYLNKIW